MKSVRHVSIDLKRADHRYEIAIAANTLSESGHWAEHWLTGTGKRLALVSNQKVFGIYGDLVKGSLEESGFEVSVWLMGDGDEYKNLDSLTGLLSFLGNKRLKRTDALVALGGGVTGDLAGFASSVYLRGIPFLQIPTTLLAMIDSSVGGKTGINFDTGKNTIGAFHQPAGVLIDIETLKTLDHRELRAGFMEAIKHGAIGSSQLLDCTVQFLRRFPPDSFSGRNLDGPLAADLIDLLYSHIKFKLEVIREDETEKPHRDDSRSRKILNFGHTVGHALEKVTDYNYFKHGEAVGYGILVAGEISNKLELLDTNSLDLLNDVVTSVGGLPVTGHLNVSEIIEAIGFDKKTIDNSLHWVLLKEIGQPVIVAQKEIPGPVILDSLTKILSN